MDKVKDQGEINRTVGTRRYDLGNVLTPREIETGFCLSAGTVRQYLKHHAEDMIQRGVARKAAGSTWLIHREEAEDVWGRKMDTPLP